MRPARSLTKDDRSEPEADSSPGCHQARHRPVQRAGAYRDALPLQGKAFRIGHLGDSNAATILGCLGAVQAALQVQGIPVGAGALDRAVASLVAAGG